MADTVPETEPTERLAMPAKRFWAIAAIIIVALFAAYWFLLRESYVMVLEGIDPADAADVVKVLDAKKIPYQLAEAGRTVLVPDDVADKARVELVGSELPMRGQVGFELFNQSDMGFTEFAQKINYQRALQGEIARTILLLDGMQTVRVHLGLPERTLFRDEQSRPKASVAVILKPGATLTQSRVNGIQRIVAGAVPELTTDAISVLDGSGRVVSPETEPAVAPISTSDALIESYRQRIAAAIRSADPTLAAQAVVSLRYIAAAPAPAQPDGASPAFASDRGRADYLLNVRILTREPLAQAQRTALAGAIETAIAFDADRGDTLVFVTGFMPPPAWAPATSQADAVVTARPEPSPPPAPFTWLTYLPFAIAFAAGLVVAAYVRDRRRTRNRRAEGLQSFAEQLRERLAAGEAQTV